MGFSSALQSPSLRRFSNALRQFAAACNILDPNTYMLWWTRKLYSIRNMKIKAEPCPRPGCRPSGAVNAKHLARNECSLVLLGDGPTATKVRELGMVGGRDLRASLLAFFRELRPRPRHSRASNRCTQSLQKPFSAPFRPWSTCIVDCRQGSNHFPHEESSHILHSGLYFICFSSSSSFPMEQSILCKSPL